MDTDNIIYFKEVGTDDKLTYYFGVSEIESPDGVMNDLAWHMLSQHESQLSSDSYSQLMTGLYVAHSKDPKSPVPKDTFALYTAYPYGQGILYAENWKFLMGILGQVPDLVKEDWKAWRTHEVKSTAPVDPLDQMNEGLKGLMDALGITVEIPEAWDEHKDRTPSAFFDQEDMMDRIMEYYNTSATAHQDVFCTLLSQTMPEVFPDEVTVDEYMKGHMGPKEEWPLVESEVLRILSHGADEEVACADSLHALRAVLMTSLDK